MSVGDAVKGYSSEYHRPVLWQEVVNNLILRRDGVFVDCTLGGGGHSQAILENISSQGRVIGIDQDDDALNYSAERLKKYSNFNTAKGNFAQVKTILKKEGINKVDGFLFDIGVSSHQLDEASRGFAFSVEGPLDMRMDRSNILTASKVLNTSLEKDLADIFYLYGEEKKSFRIAEKIIAFRKKKKIETTSELKNIISEFYSGKYLIKALSRVFQSLRIFVNKELDVLELALKDSFEILNIGGRLAVISYHSLEDRIVKNRFKYWQSDCVCPPELPLCQCDKVRQIKIIRPFPMTPEESEVKTNNRSRSAKMRICEKLAD